MQTRHQGAAGSLVSRLGRLFQGLGHLAAAPRREGGEDALEGMGSMAQPDQITRSVGSVDIREVAGRILLEHGDEGIEEFLDTKAIAIGAAAAQ